MSQDSFAILEKISESPTTAVYKAHQNVLGRTVLLKVLHKHLLRDKNLVSRFTREAKACAILRSENIVQVYDLTEVDGAPAIVMEYVEGKSLEDMILNGVQSEELLVKVAASVLNALSYAHERGVVHRDIKPGNILVSEDGIVKVTDFGLAAVTDAPSLTMEGSLIGTPAYMSPEQARGEVVDSRTDLFSLGVTLVEVLTGERILLGKSYAECITRIQSFELPSLDQFASKCSPNIFEFLKRLLAPQKEARFSSADEALNFLSSFAGEDKARKRIRKYFAKNKRVKVAIGSSVLILILAVVLLFTLRSSDGSDSKIAVVDTLHRGSIERATQPTGEKSGKDLALVQDKQLQANARKDPAKPQNLVSITPAKKTAPLSSVDSGYVSITCNPWARVYIDDEYAGTTPISGSVKIPSGRHTVMFNNPNFAPIVKQINVQPKFLTSVSADFLENSGWIYVSVNPWGDVYVDDQLRETTPSNLPIVVSAGTRRLRIHNPAFPDIVRNLMVNAGDTMHVNFSFPMKPKN